MYYKEYVKAAYRHLSTCMNLLDDIENAQKATGYARCYQQSACRIEQDEGSELVKTQKELRKSQREAKKYRELYEVLRDEKFVTKSQKSKQGKTKGRDDDKDDWDGTSVVDARC